MYDVYINGVFKKNCKTEMEVCNVLDAAPVGSKKEVCYAETDLIAEGFEDVKI